MDEGYSNQQIGYGYTEDLVKAQDWTGALRSGQLIALKMLYGDGFIDLTPEGYAKAINNLRRQSPDKARFVESELDDLLKIYLPRRRLDWRRTSQGTQARIALLPGNPWMMRDILLIRHIFRIPEGQIHVTDSKLLTYLRSKVSLKHIQQIADGSLIASWLDIHRKAAKGLPVEEYDTGLLSRELHQLAVASAKTNLTSDVIPVWLRLRPGNGVRERDKTSAPLDEVVERLIKRHRLPKHVGTALEFYLLTKDPYWVAKLDPMVVEVTSDTTSGSIGAFAISVKSLDEFITEEDWLRIWQRYIKPYQEQLMSQRGKIPHGKRTATVDRLVKALPLYQRIVRGDKLSKLLKEKDLQIFDLEIMRYDQETIRRIIRDLNILLSPEESDEDTEADNG